MQLIALRTGFVVCLTVGIVVFGRFCVSYGEARMPSRRGVDLRVSTDEIGFPSANR